jgi:SLA1 homology domain 1, SHD1
MRQLMRSFVVGVMIMALSLQPAAAWYYGGCGGCGSYGGGYYVPVQGGCCGGDIVVHHHDCCGGCGSCEPCGGCGPCEGGMMDDHQREPARAPSPPADEERMEAGPREPAAVDRPVDRTPPPEQPTLPPAEAAPPAQPPAEEANGLSNGSEAADPPMEEAPATEPPMDEAPATEPPMEEPAAEAPNGLFDEPAAPPAETEPAEEPMEEPFELFGEPEAEMPAETEEQPEEPPAEEDDDIFGASPAVLREPGGLASDEMRTWVDNTGNFSCQGRLVRFFEGEIRLLKDNGRTTTVPLYRLSAGDLEFVHRQVSAQQAEAYQTAQSAVSMPVAAN